MWKSRSQCLSSCPATRVSQLWSNSGLASTFLGLYYYRWHYNICYTVSGKVLCWVNVEICTDSTCKNRCVLFFSVIPPSWLFIWRWFTWSWLQLFWLIRCRSGLCFEAFETRAAPSSLSKSAWGRRNETRHRRTHPLNELIEVAVRISPLQITGNLRVSQSHSEPRCWLYCVRVREGQFIMFGEGWFVWGVVWHHDTVK